MGEGREWMGVLHVRESNYISLFITMGGGREWVGVLYIRESNHIRLFTTKEREESR
jgi:hypothetical protein